MADTLRSQLAAATTRLAASGSSSPAAEVRLLAGHLLGLEPAGLLTAPALAETQQQRLLALVERRAAGTPVQHLTGEAWFRHVRVEVGPGAFVPRPETEVMVGWAVEQLQALDQPGAAEPALSDDAAPLVVDLCTGSGVIALALSQEVPRARVHAVELSEQALGWAGRNLAGSGVELHAGDMANALPGLDGLVDLVICNPPYIPLAAWESVAPDVRDHDPELALFSGEDGLDALRVLTHVAARLLRPGGVVCAEHAEVQEHSVVELFLSHGGYHRVRDHPDLTGRSRFVTAVHR